MEFSLISRSINIVHPVCIERGKNAEVWDVSGRRFLDFIGGIGVLNLGHCHPLVVERSTQQLQKLIHSAFNAVPHQKYLELTRALNNFIPLGYEKTFMLTNSGTEATENALKIARASTGRQAVIAFDDAFHGRTLAALALNGKVKPYKNQIGLLPGTVFHAPFPGKDSGVTAEEAKAAVLRLFEVEVAVTDVAAIIIEPIQGEGGFRSLDAAFAVWLRRLCDENGIVLIMDEIQSGFGRTGKKFAFEALGIEPDLLLMGKSMANGLPLAAIAGKKAIVDALPRGGLGGTYSGNAVACAASLAVIETMTTTSLAEWGEAMESAIVKAHQRWHGDLPMIGELTGTGAMRGIVFKDTANATGAEHLDTLLAAAREAGILLMPSGRYRNILRLLPPLTTPPAILEEGFLLIEQALFNLRA
ncbi:aspartate aminotransferase family protein [Kalamiella sp. sgz302252]|uniref:2-aminoadipate transaminase n=1 Tax=Pantoea sp. sgz302252 TaxID=3341827 RepID=UPI0036D2F559